MNENARAQFEPTKEMRAVAEQSVDQAKVAFQQLMQAAEEAVSMLEQGEKRQAGALDISKKAMAFAEHNVLSAFELAQKIGYTMDIQDLVRMQTEFLKSQMHTLGEQVKDLSETVRKAATDSNKTFKIAVSHPD